MRAYKEALQQLLKNRLLNFRAEHGYSQEKIAELLHISPRALFDLESGKYGFSALTLMFFLSVMEVRRFRSCSGNSAESWTRRTRRAKADCTLLFVMKTLHPAAESGRALLLCVFETKEQGNVKHPGRVFRYHMDAEFICGGRYRDMPSACCLFERNCNKRRRFCVPSVSKMGA